MRWNVIRISVTLVALLPLPLLALMAQQTNSLLIEGQQGQARVIQVQGTNYVEVDGLARITGGSLRFVENQIVLALPRSGDASSPAAQCAPAQSAGYSKQFLAAGVETMREILEWRAALKTTIERSYPFSEEWFGNFRRYVQSSLKLAEASASTEMDRKALPLLVNEFETMAALTEKYLRISARRDYIAPDALKKDPLDQKLMACWKSLESMASTGQFVDDGSCR